MDYIVNGVTKSWTRMNDFHFMSGIWGFPSSSAGKESACNAGRALFHSWVRKIPWRRDRLLTPAFLGFLGGSDGKELSAIQEAWAQSLGWEGPLEEVMTTHSSILAWRIPMDRGAWQVRSRLPFPFPLYLPNSGIEPRSPATFSCIACGFFTAEPPDKWVKQTKIKSNEIESYGGSN